MFNFLLAGQEVCFLLSLSINQAINGLSTWNRFWQSTAHSLGFMFGLLALEEEEQERLFTHIEEAVGDREPVCLHVKRAKGDPWCADLFVLGLDDTLRRLRMWPSSIASWLCSMKVRACTLPYVLFSVRL